MRRRAVDASQTGEEGGGHWWALPCEELWIVMRGFASDRTCRQQSRGSVGRTIGASESTTRDRRRKRPVEWMHRCNFMGLLALASGHLRTRRGVELTGAEVAAPGVLSLAIGLMGISGVLHFSCSDTRTSGKTPPVFSPVHGAEQPGSRTSGCRRPPRARTPSPRRQVARPSGRASAAR